MKRVLLIQIREDKKIERSERESFLRIVKKSNFKLENLNICCSPLFPPDFVFKNYRGVIVGGSHFGVNDNFPQKRKLIFLIKKIVEKKYPFLGICFGLQLLAKIIGGKVIKNSFTQELGKTRNIVIIQKHKKDKIFYSMPFSFYGQEAHQWGVVKVPLQKTEILVKGKRGIIEGIKLKNAPIYGFQFHPELSRRDMIERMKQYNSQGNREFSFNEIHFFRLREGKIAPRIILNFLNYFC